MMTERVKCGICDNTILPATAQDNGGLCAQCVKIPPSRRELVAAVHAEPNPFERALAMYSSLIDSLVMETSDRHFGAISDPEITSVRFYTLDSFSYNSICFESTEVGSEVVDKIDYYLLADASARSLLLPIASKLKTISPALNSVGKSVFFASWGMGVDEVAWLIRYLNDRPTFERFLMGSGVTEEQIDVYNKPYGLKLIQEAEQVGTSNGG